nr:2Fe-2S iron-sulfur cluster-binding protein [Kutzneria albida]
MTAEPGRTAAAVLMLAGRDAGVFCGIGVCFNCLVEVNGERDVRSCQRVLVDGDEVRTR